MSIFIKRFVRILGCKIRNNIFAPSIVFRHCSLLYICQPIKNYENGHLLAAILSESRANNVYT